jgi:hypothetical protein
MAVAVIGSALRARHPRDVYLDPREFSGVVVVLGIWNLTETADNASAVHGPNVRDGLGRCGSRTTGAPGAATVDPLRWPLCSCLPALPVTRVAVFTLRGQPFCAVDAVAFRVGRAEISPGRAAVGGVRLSVGGAGAGVQQPANAVADVGDAVPVWHEIDHPTGPASRAAAGRPPFVRTEKERRA